MRGFSRALPAALALIAAAVLFNNYIVWGVHTRLTSPDSPISLEVFDAMSKTADWYCPSKMMWVGIQMSQNPGESNEDFCDRFDAAVASAQKRCPPGDPPALTRTPGEKR